MRSVAQDKPRRIGDFAPTEAKEGGSGPAAKLNPDPRNAHIPKALVQGWCE